MEANTARLHALVEAAANYYSTKYSMSGAQRYMRARFGEAIDSSSFTIGYAPDGWTSLCDHLKTSCAATHDELLASGLALRSKRGGAIDLFRERVVFAVHDADGRPVGFTGRCAPGAPTGTPKYINTPATPCFDKSRLLFGLHESREALEAGAIPVQVEGPMDAIAVTLAGQAEAVGLATMGTALTHEQATLLANAARPGGIVLVATDNDPAGRAASARDYLTYTAHGLEPRELVMISPDDGQLLKDPAEALEHAPHSLYLALTMPNIAPSLVSSILRDHLTDPRLDLGHAATRVHLATLAGQLIGELPTHRHAEETSSAALAIAHTSGSPDEVRDVRRVRGDLHRPLQFLGGAMIEDIRFSGENARYQSHVVASYGRAAVRMSGALSPGQTAELTVMIRPPQRQ